MSPTAAQITQVSNLTKGQDTNIYWHEYREGRLTASHFGKVLHQIHINSYPPSLYKTLLGEYSPEASESVQFGRNHEDSAVKQWEKLTGVHGVRFVSSWERCAGRNAGSARRRRRTPGSEMSLLNRQEELSNWNH